MQSSSPCGQNAPQGSPASPASARLPTATVVTQRPSVITEQKPVANCQTVNISPQSECSNQNAQLGTNPTTTTTDNNTPELRQQRRSVRGMWRPYN